MCQGVRLKRQLLRTQPVKQLGEGCAYKRLAGRARTVTPSHRHTGVLAPHMLRSRPAICAKCQSSGILTTPPPPPPTPPAPAFCFSMSIPDKAIQRDLFLALGVSRGINLVRGARRRQCGCIQERVRRISGKECHSEAAFGTRRGGCSAAKERACIFIPVKGDSHARRLTM